jgi:glycosyltransferase involved in cell wall biosynthesis
MQNEKIALFVPNLDGGGAERMMVNLANAFAHKGHNTDLILARKRGPYVKLVDEKVNIIDINISFANPLLLFHLVRYMRLEKPIAILSAMTYPNIAILIAHFFAMTSTKVVISERVTMGVQSKNIFSLKERLKPLAARLTYKKADKIVAISNGVAKNLIDTIYISKEKITTIYNPVVTNALFVNKSKPSHPFFNSNRKIILAAGRLVPQKDFSTLINAFDKIAFKDELYLIILGEGPLREDLNRQIESLELTQFISLPGYVENLFSYMQHASVFVLSSAWEGFGNVLVEAMACGCPVVSTDCPSGPSEILSSGKFGALVAPNDEYALADAISSTLACPVSSEILRTRACSFKAEVIADQYLKLML